MQSRKESANNRNNSFSFLQSSWHMYVSTPGNTHAAPPTWGGGGPWWPSFFQDPCCASSWGGGQQAASSGSATAQVCLHHMHSPKPEQMHQLNFSSQPTRTNKLMGIQSGTAVAYVLPYREMDTVGQWAKTCSLKRKGRKCWQLHIPLDTCANLKMVDTQLSLWKSLWQQKIGKQHQIVSSAVSSPSGESLSEDTISCL